MFASDRPISYQERNHLLPSSVALIWPFVNVAKSTGPYELFLDTNALIKGQWSAEITEEMRAKTTLNPWPALMEQLVSNQALSVSSIETMISPFLESGFRFQNGFARKQYDLLHKNAAQIRYQYSVLFPFVAIMRSLLNEKVKADVAIDRVIEVSKAEVPLFAGCFMLMVLAVLLKAKQSWKLAGDTKPAYSYLESFLAYQPSKKNESGHICINYLRNRSGDLSLMYTLPTLYQNGFQFSGEPVLVTGDKALHRLVLRVFPALYQHGRGVAFTIAPNELGEEMHAATLRAVSNFRINRSETKKMKFRKMEKLFELAQTFCALDEEKATLAKAWLEWCKPGMGLRMNLS